MSRGEGILPYSCEEIYKILDQVDRRGDYDEMFDKVCLIGIRVWLIIIIKGNVVQKLDDRL